MKGPRMTWWPPSFSFCVIMLTPLACELLLMAMGSSAKLRPTMARPTP